MLEFTRVPHEGSESAVDAPAGWISQGAISFTDVVVRYDNKKRVLNGLSFDIQPGEKIAPAVVRGDFAIGVHRARHLSPIDVA